MRSAITFLFCVCASFVLGAQSPQLVRDPSAPIMVFDSTTCNFGTVYQGSTVDFDFRFTNKGKTPLVISNVTGSSGCIVPTYPKEPIPPGKSAVIKVVFNTTGKFGQQQKSVTVSSNASEPTIVLTIKGSVVQTPPDPNAPILHFDSATFWFDTVVQGTIVYHEYRYTNKGKTPLIITDVPTGCGCLIAEYPKGPIPPGGTGVIKLRFSTVGKSGMQDKAPTINSNNGTGPVVIHITGYVKPRIQTNTPSQPVPAEKPNR